MITKYAKYCLYPSILFISVFIVTNFSKAQTTIISSPYSQTVNINTPIVQSQQTKIVCTILQYDLYQGLSDTNNDKSIIQLQRFLFEKSYLTNTPNGYFGQGTLSAVKKFQGSYGISNTGRVGPLTRKQIRDQSCVTNNAASVINAVPTLSPTPIIARINESNLTVNYPVASSTLISDSNFTIRWKNISKSIYSISLEDIYGVGAGHIAQSVSGDSYEWKVGKVFSSKTNSEIFVSPGIYRIKLTNAGFSSNSTPDQYSGLFTVVAKPITIKSIMPSSVANSEDSSVVIYGNGFDNTTKIHFDIYNNDTVVKPYFISVDGKVLVFNVSSNISTGQYFISVNNTFGDGATSSPSNPVSLTITNN